MRGNFVKRQDKHGYLVEMNPVCMQKTLVGTLRFPKWRKNAPIFALNLCAKRVEATSSK